MVRATGTVAAAPVVAVPGGIGLAVDPDDHWNNTTTTTFNNSVNAVSFGFVATAILISLFVVMAVFERILRPPSPNNDADATRNPDMRKPADYPSPKISVYGRGVLVLMPGERVPTFLAHPMPTPTPYKSQPRSPPKLSS